MFEELGRADPRGGRADALPRRARSPTRPSSSSQPAAGAARTLAVRARARCRAPTRSQPPAAGRDRARGAARAHADAAAAAAGRQRASRRRPQRPVLVRLGQEVQALPRRVGARRRLRARRHRDWPPAAPARPSTRDPRRPSAAGRATLDPRAPTSTPCCDRRSGTCVTPTLSMRCSRRPSAAWASRVESDAGSPTADVPSLERLGADPLLLVACLALLGVAAASRRRRRATDGWTPTWPTGSRVHAVWAEWLARRSLARRRGRRRASSPWPSGSSRDARGRGRAARRRRRRHRRSSSTAKHAYADRGPTSGSAIALPSSYSFPSGHARRASRSSVCSAARRDAARTRREPRRGDRCGSRARRTDRREPRRARRPLRDATCSPARRYGLRGLWLQLGRAACSPAASRRAQVTPLDAPVASRSWPRHRRQTARPSSSRSSGPSSPGSVTTFDPDALTARARRARGARWARPASGTTRPRRPASRRSTPA